MHTLVIDHEIFGTGAVSQAGGDVPQRGGEAGYADAAAINVGSRELAEDGVVIGVRREVIDDLQAVAHQRTRRSPGVVEHKGQPSPPIAKVVDAQLAAQELAHIVDRLTDPTRPTGADHRLGTTLDRCTGGIDERASQQCLATSVEPTPKPVQHLPQHCRARLLRGQIRASPAANACTNRSWNTLA